MVERNLSYYMESQVRALLLRGEEKDRDFWGGLFVSKDQLQKDMVNSLKFLEVNLKKNYTHVHSLLVEQNEHIDILIDKLSKEQVQYSRNRNRCSRPVPWKGTGAVDLFLGKEQVQ